MGEAERHNVPYLSERAMAMVEALRVPREADLRGLCDQLRFEGIAYRVYEAGGAQCLAVQDPADGPRVQALWARGEARPGRPAAAPVPGAALWPAGLGIGFLAALRGAPVTVALGLCALLSYPFLDLSEGGLTPWLQCLLIVPVTPHDAFISYPSLEASLAAGHLWRLWTPAFVHFSVLHLVFNGLWLWEFGRRIEGAEGSLRMLELFLFVAPCAAVLQYGVGEHPLFGGLSGVVYGLLAYLMVQQRLRPRPAYRLPPALPGLLLVLLALLATGVTEPFGLAIANGAHFGGLAAGALWGLLRVVLPGPPRRTLGGV